MSQPAPTNETASDPKRYRKTLNLPRTTFPMKANLLQNEPASLKRWDRLGLYEAIRGIRAGRERFVFHDGPPYANGAIHLGHLMNKCLKDFVVRSRTMAGRDCPFVPGWDCHGLPIEHKVVSELVESGKADRLKALDDDARRMAIRRQCRDHAQKHIKLQSGQMRRLLTLADYDNPYLTMTPGYEGATLDVLATLLERGLVYRALKPVHWSIANETALAEAELEYEDREDTSVYVDFEAADAGAVYDAFGLPRDEHPEQTPCFMIWTTTPWTLPANMAIAVHPRFEYALVRVEGNVVVLAHDLIASVTATGGAEDVRVLATTTGQRLVGVAYRHPFRDQPPAVSDNQPEGLTLNPDRVWTIVEADYVTLEDGTGLVHTATGHGAEDYQTGLRVGIPVYCPVRGDGTYDESVPDWLRGVDVFKANAMVVDRLRQSGHLFHEQTFTHSYPHDWRSKTPVIFRATEQWFVGVDLPVSGAASLREMALDAVAQKPAGTEGTIQFVPEWGRNRMRGMLESRPDWCISRQRAWGLPIPAFFLPDGTPFMTAASVHAVAEVIRTEGSDFWFTASPEQLLGRYEPAADPDAPAALLGGNGREALGALRKGRDILDVWFESGSSWNAVMRRRSDGRDFPVDLYLEGSDQHRGWFQLSLLTALGMEGRPPMRQILTHGFMVGKDGRKLSKSSGHTIDDLFKTFGVDVLRWWVCSLSYENDAKVDESFFRLAGESYRKVRNTLRFMLSNLGDFTPTRSAGGRDARPAGTEGVQDGQDARPTGTEGHCVDLGSFPATSPDAWVLGQFDALAAKVIDAYERYDYQCVHKSLYNFCNETLSAIYLAAVKDRLYCDRPDSTRRRRTQTTLWELTDGLTRLLAPVLCHTADEAHRALWKAGTDDTQRCVHLLEFIASFGVEADEGFEVVMRARDAALSALERAKAPVDQGGVALDNPLDAGLILPDPDGVLGRFDPVDLADLAGVSRVRLDPGADGVVVVDLRGEPRCQRSWKRDGTVRERGDGGMLSDRDAEAVGA